MTRLFLLFATLLANMAMAMGEGTQAFPDTPENRRIVDQAWDEYRRLDAEHGQFIDVNGIRMHYLEWGDESGVPLIWSHGYSSTGYELANVGPQLAEAGYHVYSITYRGHGQTQVGDYAFSLSHIADDIAAMMDALGIERAVIGGLSLGGGVTTAFYDHYPDRVLGLVLEDGGADAVQARTEKMYEMAKQMADAIPPFEALVFNSRFEAFQAIAGFYVPGWGGNMPSGVAPMFQAWISERDDGKFVPHYDGPRLLGEGVATFDPARSHELPLLGQSWRRTHPIITYRNLNVPMLIIDPTGDPFDPSESFRRLRDLHPSLVEIVEYPDTPHAAHPMRPDWFLRDLRGLLERL
ncbi:alpha/beta fold hydrolase [Parahaliea mediterranea]|uniref:Alpha/beta hydrolase n=1 Tax=Parahaliea mediterranea TaxID=651086 RepID=A0A939IJG4_9GAMM|nr:alpha/beta hydrolase [Parahaliea mediterranea]MBN7797639.1 alpha/beta hydrolase [Parahaliea mediterranea]